jgi:predicted 3-demethylubiquinone-9 3-methyltransferase (glyoxalase superfamily)
MPLVIEPSSGKLSGDARQPPAENDDDCGFTCNPLLYSRVRRDGQGEARVLNGGPVFKFNEAVSFQILCDSQEEIDSYWTKLSESGAPNAQQCGWLKDRFGPSWQVVPRGMPELLKEPSSVTVHGPGVTSV